jgi:peptidoglycan/xylan/chitin deacetylase (PgdA/CDA1 family)
MTLRVIVCGSREWTNKKVARMVLEELPPGTTVIHGDNGNDECTLGADRIAGQIAKELGLDVIPEPADWSRGKRGGPERNQRMIDKYEPHFVIALHDKIWAGKGTSDMLQRADAAGLKSYLFTSQWETLKRGPWFVRRTKKVAQNG